MYTRKFHTGMKPQIHYSLINHIRHILLPGKVAQVYVNLKATVSGQYTLLASMHCDQLTDIHGWTQILVI